MVDDTPVPPGWPFDEAPQTPPPGAPRFEPPAPAAPAPPAPGQPPQPSYQPPPPASGQPPPAPGYSAPPPTPGFVPPPPAPAPGYAPPPQPYASPYEPPIPNQPPPPQQYRPPPGWAPTAPPKKNRKPLWVTLGVIFAVLALGVGSCTVWFVGTVTAPVDEANRFLAAIDRGDYATAAAMTDPSCSNVTIAGLEETFGGDDIGYNLNNSSVVNSSATVQGSFSQGTASYRNITVTLQKRNGDWGVCSYSRQ